MQRKVLITGANGFFGRHLLTSLHEQGVPGVALVRRASEWPEAAWEAELGRPQVLEGSPMEPAGWTRAAEGVGTIVHAAGIVHHSRRGAEPMFHFNVESTLQTVRAAKDLGARVVFMSSSGTVGCFKHPDLTADEHAPYAEGVVSRWPYYASKIEAERQAQRLADKLGVELVIARMPVLLGPKDHRFRSTGHVLRVLEGRIPAVPPGGMHFADIRDVAAATARLTQLPRVRSVYHFPGTQASLSAFFKMVCEVSGAKVTERKLPGWLLLQIASGIERWSDTARLPGTARWPDPVVLEMSTCHWGISSLWTHAELDYAPRLARQTLSDTVAWVRTHQAEASAARH